MDLILFDFEKTDAESTLQSGWKASDINFFCGVFLLFAEYSYPSQFEESSAEKSTLS